MLLIILPTSLSLGGVAFVVVVVDAWTQILSIELRAEIVLADLLLAFMGSCRMMTRLGMIGHVLLTQTLGL